MWVTHGVPSPQMPNRVLGCLRSMSPKTRSDDDTEGHYKQRLTDDDTEGHVHLKQ